MDPDTALERIRELAQEIVERTDNTDNYEYEYDRITADLGAELAEVFTGLDEWVKKGGFLPKDWRV